VIQLAERRCAEQGDTYSVQDLRYVPTVLEEGSGDAARPGSFWFSLVVHGVALAALSVSGIDAAPHHQEVKQRAIALVSDMSPYLLPPAPTSAGGGGGGGDRDKLPASKGVLPRFSREQITPPAAVIRNEAPRLKAEPTVVAPPELQPVAPPGPIGDPTSSALGPPSNGPGSGGGIGSGGGGGVGSGSGPGVGPGSGGGIGGGVYRIGGGVSAPRILYAPDPEYSEEARKAKYQGTVVLLAVIGPDGRPREVRVQRSLGMGLDDKAVEAIRKWRFEPARKDGVPVAVEVHVEVNFHLY